MGIALLLHISGVVVWVGGMFLAYMVLRPVAAQLLEPPPRLALWAGVFRYFFLWVWAAVILILGSGLYMMSLMGGFALAPLYVNIMFALGLLMMGIFVYIFFSPFPALVHRVAAQDWKPAGEALARIRTLVAINLVLGLITIAAATLGRAMVTGVPQ